MLSNLPLELFEHCITYLSQAPQLVTLTKLAKSINNLLRPCRVSVHYHHLIFPTDETWISLFTTLTSSYTCVAHHFLSCDITDEHLNILWSASTHDIHTLRFHNVRRVKNYGMIQQHQQHLVIPTVLQNLQHLAISRSGTVARDVACDIARLSSSSLQTLLLDWIDDSNSHNDTSQTPSSLCQRLMGTIFPVLRTLALVNSPNILDMSILQQMPHIEALFLGGSCIHDNVITTIRTSTSLRVVECSFHDEKIIRQLRQEDDDHVTPHRDSDSADESAIAALATPHVSDAGDRVVLFPRLPISMSASQNVTPTPDPVTSTTTLDDAAAMSEDDAASARRAARQRARSSGVQYLNQHIVQLLRPPVITSTTPPPTTTATATSDGAIHQLSKLFVIDFRHITDADVQQLYTLCPHLHSTPTLSYAVNCTDQYQRTALHHACLQGDEEMARLFIRMEVDVETKDKKGNTPLMRAAEYGYASICRMLIRAGALVTCQSHNLESPLYIASLKGHADAVEAILTTAPNVDLLNQATLYDGWTPAMAAIINGNVTTLETILKHGILINQTNKYGQTALHIAVRLGFVPGVVALLRAGVDVNAGHEPILRVTSRVNQDRIRDLLLAAGATLKKTKSKPPRVRIRTPHAHAHVVTRAE